MNLYISNLGDQVTDESLRAVFATYGMVRSSIIIRDEVNGHSRGFAFVDMPDSDAAGRAMARVHGSVLNGRSVEVQEASQGFPEQQLATRP